MLYLVIPAYNEEVNIEQVVLSWHSALSKALRDGTLNANERERRRFARIIKR